MQPVTATSSDRELLEAWQAHRDEAAFRLLCDRHAPLVANACRRMGAPDPEDVCQGVFILLAQRPQAVGDPARLVGWLLVSARHLAANQRRAHERRRKYERNAAMESERHEVPEPPSGWAELRPLLDEALEQLSPARREALVRFYFEGRSQADIAQELGCSPQAVKTRVAEGMERLRQFFARRGMVVGTAVLASGLASECSAAEPHLAAACAKAALVPGTAPSAAALAGGAVVKAKLVLAATVATSVLTVGGGVVAVQALRSAPAPVPVVAPAAPTAPAPVTAPQARTFARWQQARIGLAITWGPFAIPGGTWQGRSGVGYGEQIMREARIGAAEYAAMATSWRPGRYAPDDWVELAEQAGARYVLVTAKHTDGFAMYASAASDFQLTRNTGLDPVADVAAACRRRGLLFGVEYAAATDLHERDARGNTWDFSGKRDFDRYFRGKCLPQLGELARLHQPDLLFLTEVYPGRDLTQAQAVAIEEAVRDGNPAGILAVQSTFDYEPQATFTNRPESGPCISRVFEAPRNAGGVGLEGFETLNYTAGFRRDYTHWRSPATMAARVAHQVAQGHNLVIAVGPDADGTIPVEAAKTLRGLGAWLGDHAEAVYGTGPSPWSVAGNPPTTTRGATGYVFITEWPVDGICRIDGGGRRIGAVASVLKDTALGEPVVADLPVRQSGRRIEITLPDRLRTAVVPVLRLELVP